VRAEDELTRWNLRNRTKTQLVLVLIGQPDSIAMDAHLVRGCPS
jgi:hypothetical protein